MGLTPHGIHGCTRAGWGGGVLTRGGVRGAEVLSGLEHMVFMPGDYVCQIGSVSKDVFFISKGQVFVRGAGRLRTTLMLFRRPVRGNASVT